MMRPGSIRIPFPARVCIIPPSAGDGDFLGAIWFRPGKLTCQVACRG